jgi:glycerol-3-phosphate acyltransferase PlsY
VLIEIAIALAAGFVCGSIPFGPLFARLRNVDLRKVGSGNIGATNAARALGKPLGVLVLICDAAKAIVPLLIARRMQLADEAVAALGFGAVLGHMFSPWLRFRGGKGVATGLGVFLVLAPVEAGIAAGVWVLLYATTRVSSVGSLVAVSALPALLWWRHEPRAFVALALALLPLILLKHRGNIARLLRREESKV